MPSIRAADMPHATEAGASRVTAAIRNASAKVGVDFNFMLKKAEQESSLNPTAEASSSSATGLYQFINQTWLDVVDRYGDKHGYSQYANVIERGRDGRAYVADPEMRQKILDLRKDPEAAAIFAAEFTKANSEHLKQEIGRPVGATDLYMAHFMGPAGAGKFLRGMQQNPDMKASEIFPDAAAANPGVFKDRATGEDLSLRQIYDRFARKFQDGVSRNAEIVGAQPVFGSAMSAARAAAAVASPPAISASGKDSTDDPASFLVDTPGKSYVVDPIQILALAALDYPSATRDGVWAGNLWSTDRDSGGGAGIGQAAGRAYKGAQSITSPRRKDVSI